MAHTVLTITFFFLKKKTNKIINGNVLTVCYKNVKSICKECEATSCDCIYRRYHGKRRNVGQDVSVGEHCPFWVS